MNTGEKEFGVIVCSDCQTPKTVDLTLDNKTTECHRCGKRLEMDMVKIHYRADSREEASWAVGQINAKMNDGELPDREDEKDEDEDPYTRASKEAEVASNEKERLLIICNVLGEEMGSYEVKDIKKVYSILGREGVEIEKKLKRLEEIYEPEEGVFRSV